MNITSYKKAIISGFLLGTCIFVAYTLFTCILYYLLDGKFFVGKGGTEPAINGISFNVVQIIAVVISAIIPILLIRYKNVNYYMLSIFIAIVLYIIYFIAYFVCLSSMPLEMALKFPMNSFDALVYGVFTFPLGATIGLLANGGINFWLNRK